MLPKTSTSCSYKMKQPDNGKAGSKGDMVHQQLENKLNLDIKLHELGPLALQTLHKLVSLVHVGINPTDRQDQCISTSNLEGNLENDCKKMMMTQSCSLEDDSVANILWNLEPMTLRDVFLAMVNSFPRTLEALILQMLSPVAAEVLTRKFDELDQQMTEEDRSMFYQRFYSVFDDQSSAMNAILNGKESFALQAFKNVLELHMGKTLGGSNHRSR